MRNTEESEAIAMMNESILYHLIQEMTDEQAEQVSGGDTGEWYRICPKCGAKMNLILICENCHYTAY